MKTSYDVISIETKCGLDIVDITDKIKNFIEQSEIKNGLVNVQSLHTTATIFVNENEPELLKDLKNHLEKLAPKKNEYYHDDFNVRTVNMCEDECANGHSHCKAIHLPTSVSLNIVFNKLQLGAWQRILFIELDRARKRKVGIQVIGN